MTESILIHISRARFILIWDLCRNIANWDKIPAVTHKFIWTSKKKTLCQNFNLIVRKFPVRSPDRKTEQKDPSGYQWRCRSRLYNLSSEIPMIDGFDNSTTLWVSSSFRKSCLYWYEQNQILALLKTFPYYNVKTNAEVVEVVKGGGIIAFFVFKAW